MRNSSSPSPPARRNPPRQCRKQSARQRVVQQQRQQRQQRQQQPSRPSTDMPSPTASSEPPFSLHANRPAHHFYVEHPPTQSKHHKQSKGHQKPSATLSATQIALLNRIFAAFDSSDTQRVTLSDILRVAHQHALPYTAEQARHMLRFWDSSATQSLSPCDFHSIALESNFIQPASK